MKKRGYFFTIDVSIAMVIIVTGFLLIWSFYLNEAKKEQPYFYAQDVLDFMSNTPVSAVIGTVPYIQKLVRDGNITNLDNTILEQTALSYMNEIGNCIWPDCEPHLSENITRNTLQDVIPEQYGMHVILNSSTLYVKNATTGRPENESDILISSKKVVVVVFNKVNLSDPYMMEVRVWR